MTHYGSPVLNPTICQRRFEKGCFYFLLVFIKDVLKLQNKLRKVVESKHAACHRLHRSLHASHVCVTPSPE